MEASIHLNINFQDGFQQQEWTLYVDLYINSLSINS